MQQVSQRLAINSFSPGVAGVKTPSGKNADLPDTNQFMANARWANSRYMDMLEYSIDTLLVGETADSLLALAYACPLIAGTAVYRARTLLSMLLPGLHFDDLTICNAQGVYKQGPQEPGGAMQKNRVHDLMLYPVPATQTLQVQYATAGTLEFFDLLGRSCDRYVLGPGGKVVLDVSTLPRGVLSYRYLANDGSVFFGKLILQ